MTPILSSFKTAGRALLVAAVLGTGGLAAAPAFAQDPAMNFSLELGSPSGPSFNFEVEGGNDGFRRGGNDDDGFRRSCLSDRQVIRGLRNNGFSRVEVVESNRRHAEALGRYGRSQYLLSVNKCTGEVDVERVRRQRGNSFGLQFNFGN